MPLGREKSTVEYEISCGWCISFPRNWVYENESDSGQFVFYPPDSDLTVRITPFHAERQGVLAPIDVMKAAFMRTIPEFAKSKENELYAITDFHSTAFECTQEESGKTVFQVGIGYYTTGELLSVNMFSTSKESCDQTLKFLKTLKKVK